ncbi:MAG: aspartyl protease family protein [Bacteroidales bacterium]|jgi:hypothetical protein|nr:aspartyl protease family protein [Bacteroidales bacterium]
MNIKQISYLLIIILLSGCSVTWQEAMRYGEVPKAFCDSVAVETHLGLMIVPVTIRGEEYRFLYDTGAPFSISHRVQEACAFEVLTNGKIVDSDNNRSKVEYVQVDTLWLGNTSFIEQTAFVGDFSSNPRIQCLEIDGILGSNLMRHCNWTVDFEEKQLSFYNTTPDTTGMMKVPFKTNNQYDLIVNLMMGKAEVNNVKIDYGFNGRLDIKERAYKQLMETGVNDTFLIEWGTSRAGIIGKETPLDKKLSPLDSLLMGEVLFQNIIYGSSTLSLLGTQLLSHYTITIDWRAHQLYFKHTMTVSGASTSYCFSAGYSATQGLYVQSVIQSTVADSLGLQPGMPIHSVNEIVYTQDNFCDYLKLMNENPDTLHLVVKQDSRLVPMTISKDILFP